MKKKYLKILAPALAVLLIFATIVFLNKIKQPESSSSLPEEASQNESQESEQSLAESSQEQAQTSTSAPTKPTAGKTELENSQGPQDTQSKGYYYNYPGVNPSPAKTEAGKWYLLLVNFDYCLPKGYSFEKTTLGGTSLDARVAPHFKQMQAAAASEGLKIVPLSGYRSLEAQERLFNQTVNEYKNQGFDEKTSVAKASKRRQPPGCSEHNAGLAMDVCEIRRDFENTAEFKWLQENAADFGFIMRYPKDKVDITRVQYEPWHWRYVGVDVAREIKDRGICLEEYLGL